MSKFFSSLLLISLILTACTSKWDHSDPEMPAELRELNETILNEQLGFLDEDPENLDALFEVAFRYQQLGDWGKAVKYYEKVLELVDTDFATLNNLAYIYEEMEDYETSAEYIKLLYEANQSNIEVIKDAVRILLKSGDTLNARHALDNFAAKMLSGETPDPLTQALVDELSEDISTWESENE